MNEPCNPLQAFVPIKNYRNYSCIEEKQNNNENAFAVFHS